MLGYVLLDEEWGVARLVWSPTGGESGFRPARLRLHARGGIQEDLWQRDFTCNAMAMRIGPDGDAATSTWEDPTGGMRDLRARLIRMVHPARLREDPLRLLRAFRLACTLEFQIERLTFDAIHVRTRDGILSVAAERTRDELFKIFACPDSLAWILQMDETGLLTTVFPEIQGLKGLKQGKFHHLDAWNHTLEAYRILEEGCRTGLVQLAPWDRELKEWLAKPEDVLPLLKAAVLFHDIGKPGTYTVDAEGEPHFYGHAARGADIVAETMRRLRTSRQEEERTRKWVRYHMGPVHMMRAMESGSPDRKGKDPLLEKTWERCPGHTPRFTRRFSRHGRAFRNGRPAEDLLPVAGFPSRTLLPTRCRIDRWKTPRHGQGPHGYPGDSFRPGSGTTAAPPRGGSGGRRGQEPRRGTPSGRIPGRIEEGLDDKEEVPHE